jgi:hypothetical protein
VAFTNVRVVQGTGCNAGASISVTSPGQFAITAPAPCDNYGYMPRGGYAILPLNCSGTTCVETLPGNAAYWRPLRLNLAANGSVTHANFDDSGLLSDCGAGVPVNSSVQVTDANTLRYQQVAANCQSSGNLIIGWTVVLTRQ